MGLRLVMILHHRSALIVLCALVATIIPTPSGTRAAQAHFWVRSQISHESHWASDIVSDSETNSTQSQHLTGDRVPLEERSTATLAQLNQFVDFRQSRTADKCCNQMTLSGNKIMSSEVDGVAVDVTFDRTHPISITDSLTTYLPFVAQNFTHPLLNGDFEVVDGSFAVYWEPEGDLSVSITDKLSNRDPCYSGSYCALLGDPDYPCDGVPLGYGRVCQTFGIPSTGTPKLSFYYRIFSYDECKEGRFDCFEVYIDDIIPDETPPIQVLVDGSQDGIYGCDDLDITDWKEFPKEGAPKYDLSVIPDGDGGTVDYRGKTARLCFYNHSRELEGYTIAWYNTWVYVDDVQIKQE